MKTLLLLVQVFWVLSTAVAQEVPMDLPSAIQKARPGAIWTVGETYGTLVWLDAVQTKPTLEELQTAWTAVLADRAAEAADAAAREVKRQNVVNAVATLRQWSTDAATTHTNWPGMTAQAKDTAQREVIRRLGIFFSNFADLIEAQRVDQN